MFEMFEMFAMAQKSNERLQNSNNQKHFGFMCFKCFHVLTAGLTFSELFDKDEEAKFRNTKNGLNCSFYTS